MKPLLRRTELVIASIAHALTIMMIMEHLTRLNPSMLGWLITLIPLALVTAVFKRFAAIVLPIAIAYVALNPYFHWSFSLFYMTQPKWFRLDLILTLFTLMYVIIRTVAKRWNWGPLLMFLTASTGTLYALTGNPIVIWIHVSVATVFGAYLLQNLHWLLWPYPVLWALYRRKALKMI